MALGELFLNHKVQSGMEIIFEFSNPAVNYALFWLCLETKYNVIVPCVSFCKQTTPIVVRIFLQTMFLNLNTLLIDSLLYNICFIFLNLQIILNVLIINFLVYIHFCLFSFT